MCSKFKCFLNSALIFQILSLRCTGCENCIKIGTACPVTSVGYSGAGQDMQIKWICHDNINCLGR